MVRKDKTMEERCENCKFYVQHSGNTFGDCVRFPPTVTMDHDEFPVTRREKWCGEWQPKAAPVAKDEEYCDYYRVFDLRNIYEAGCNHKHKVSREFATYCPNCGKRIRFHE